MMTRSALRLSLVMLALAATACCANKEYHYWQKIDPTTAIYLTGPKAQQMLEQDISQCVHEIIELDKLAIVRENGGKAPTLANDFSQKAQAEALSKLPAYDVPEYIRELRVDHKNFHDFDGCMRHMGWERVKYVDPQAEFRAKTIYNSTGEYSVRGNRPSARADVADEGPSAAMRREEEDLKRR